jgi:hypothetical protein
MSDDCYWFTEGKCFLNKGELPEQWIRNWIQQSPKAREDVINCAMKKGKCDAVPDEYIEWAEDLPDVEDEREINDRMQKFLNRFIDHHRADFTIDPLNDNEEEDE